MAYRIDPNKCSACGQCTEWCSNGAVKYPPKVGNGYNAPIIDREACVGCGVCADECPGGAIKEIKE